jgi:hypothetical protein
MTGRLRLKAKVERALNPVTSDERWDLKPSDGDYKR